MLENLEQIASARKLSTVGGACDGVRESTASVDPRVPELEYRLGLSEERCTKLDYMPDSPPTRSGFTSRAPAKFRSQYHVGPNATDQSLVTISWSESFSSLAA